MKNLFLAFLATAIIAVIFTSCEILEPDAPGLLVPLTVDEDPSLPSIDVNGTQLHAEQFGNPTDPMIVVLHGGPGGDYRSMLNCSRFSEDGFTVVFYDQRGSGLSRRHDRQIYTMQLLIDDLDSVIRHYRRTTEQKVILLGKSWGAMLATAYVNAHPEAISGLVLIEPGGFTWHDAEEYAKRTRNFEPFDETANDYLYLDQIFTAGDHNKLDYKAALQGGADFAEGNRVGNAGPYPFWRKGAVFSAAAIDLAREHPFDFTTNLNRYTTKVLFLYSELNQAYGRSHAQKVSSAYPTVDLREITGTGHEMPYFGWGRFYPTVLNYLNTIR